MKKGLLILILCAIVFTAASVIAVTVLVPLIRYNQAEAALNEGRYEDAIAAFADLGDYKDCSSCWNPMAAKANWMRKKEQACRSSRSEIIPGQFDLYRSSIPLGKSWIKYTEILSSCSR